MAESRPSLYSRMLSILSPRLTGGLIASSLFLILVALSNAFAAYDAVANSDLQALGMRIFAIMLYAIPAAGILKMKRWARFLGIFVAAIACLLGVLTFVAVSNADGVFIIITHGAVLICLLSKKNRSAFTAQTS